MDRKKILIIAGGAVFLIIIIYVTSLLLKPKEVTGPVLSIQNITVSNSVDENNKPIEPTDIFPTNQAVIWVSARVMNAPESTNVRAIFYYPNKKQVRPP